MALFQNPFSLEVPVQVGILNLTFFINENLFVSNAEVASIPHNHHDFEMRYVTAGTCRQFVDSRQYLATRGDLLLVHPFEYHCQSLMSDTAHSEQYNLRFSPGASRRKGKSGLPTRADQSAVPPGGKTAHP